MTLKPKTALLALLIFAAIPAQFAQRRRGAEAHHLACRKRRDKDHARQGRYFDRRHRPGADRQRGARQEQRRHDRGDCRAERRRLGPKDIQTTNFNVQPLYEERKDGRAPKIVGYQVTNSVRITVRDVGKLGQILDRVVTLGATDVNAIEFGVAEPEALKDEARKLAMRNAIANAKLYAEAAGAKLGKVLTISEDQGIIVARSMAPAPMEMAAKAVPIEAGTATVEARVSVTFELE